jgi:cytochrome P450
MNAMEDPVIFLVDRLLDDIAARGRVDLIADFASAIPVEVIGNLLGVPHGEREPLRDWSLNILGALEPVITPEAFERAETSVRDFLAYLRVLVADRRAHPNDAERDVLTRLIAGEALTELHLHPQCRSRDHDQSDRQRIARAARVARRTGTAARESEPCGTSRRRDAAFR